VTITIAMTAPYRRLVCVAAALGLLVSVAMAGKVRGAAANAPERKTHTVTMEATSFRPERLTVAAGDTVVWINKDPFPHTATSKAGAFDSGSIAPEKSWKFTTVKKGEFDYVCTLHPTMKARLTVK
jgi:plastocyanin